MSMTLVNRLDSSAPNHAIQISFHPRATMPERLSQRAKELGISAEQLALRLISEGMRGYQVPKGRAAQGKTFTDFLVRNGALAS